MNKIFKIILLFIALSGFACGSDCSIDKPKNLKPIDWEGWNDVYTVYWNTSMECSEASNNPIFGREINVNGYVHFNGIYSNGTYDIPSLRDNKYDVFIHWYDPLILNVLTEIDLTKKCYIKGKLSYSTIQTMCCNVVPEVWIENIDDIYFEK